MRRHLTPDGVIYMPRRPLERENWDFQCAEIQNERGSLCACQVEPGTSSSKSDKSPFSSCNAFVDVCLL